MRASLTLVSFLNKIHFIWNGVDLLQLPYGEHLRMNKLSKTSRTKHAVRPSGRVCYCDESHRRKLKQKMHVLAGRFSSAPGPFIL